jgi:hypothetical protein
MTSPFLKNGSAARISGRSKERKMRKARRDARGRRMGGKLSPGIIREARKT